MPAQASLHSAGRHGFRSNGKCNRHSLTWAPGYLAVAGSERVRASGAGGAQLKETCAINASLTALGRVIAELVEAQRRGPAARHHVPYRDSRLTFLLQARACRPAFGERVLACLMFGCKRLH